MTKLTSFQKHKAHKIAISETPGLIHKGKLMCIKCNKFIKWANEEEIRVFNERHFDVITYQQFMDELHKPTHEKDIRVEYMYLVVSYQDKEKVKQLGARWDEQHKLWYVSTSTPHLQKLKPWIHESDQIRLGLMAPPTPIKITPLRAMLDAMTPK